MPDHDVRRCFMKSWEERSCNGADGGCTWWAHLKFTRTSIAPTILPKKIEDAGEASATVGVGPAAALWSSQRKRARVTPVATTKDRSEVLQGTLDLMVHKTLDALGPLHGYGIARRLEQLSEDRLRLNEGTVYNSLLRLSQAGWISSEWGASESHRKAKFYSITKTGRKQLARETDSWERIAGVIRRMLRLGSAH
jgi:PadR family transcriptional regulator, regulatory protein PadR